MSKFISGGKKKSNRVVVSSQDRGSSIKKKFSFLKWLDPFNYVDLWVMPRIKCVTNNSIVEFLVNAFFALLFAWIIYSLLGVAFGNSSPLVIVYSASMEPSFFRGDVMALKGVDPQLLSEKEVFVNDNIAGRFVDSFVTPLYDSRGVLKSIKVGGSEINYEKNGAVVVYSAINPSIPSLNNKQIIHRVILRLVALDGNFVLTKGDNDSTNYTFDQVANSQGVRLTLFALPVNELDGQAFFRIPIIGCVKLWLFDDLPSLVLRGSLPSDFKGIC